MCAIFKGTFVGVISGKAGGSVFSRNKGGAYIKEFVIPTNPNTASQQARKAVFGQLATDWKALSKAEQQQWIDATPNFPYVNRVGDTKNYTGQQLFMKLNQNLLVSGNTQLTVPPTPATMPTTAMGAFVMDLTAGALTTGTQALTVNPTGTTLVVKMTTGLSSGVNRPSSGLFKEVLVVAATTSIDFATGYVAVFGEPSVGATVFIKVDMINDTTGQRQTIGQATTVVTQT